MAGRKFTAISLLMLNLLSLLPLLTISFSHDQPTDRRILVLLDDLALKSSHSIFFTSLQSRGFDLDFKLADDPSIAVKRYGQYLYDGLILFSPSTDRFGGSLDLEGVLDFVDSGHDLILAADVSASDLIRSVAAECGVDFDEDPSAMVIDHIGYAVSQIEGDHTLIAADDFVQSDIILGNAKIEAPVLFKGTGHSLNPDNSLVLKVLSASSSAYSANPASKLSNPPSLTGSAISLVSVVQARNNARIIISGSLDLFGNRLFRSGVQKAGSSYKYEKSGNEQFVTELSKWVFHERGHLKAVNLKHNKVGGTDEPSMYRINDDLEFSVEIYEWTGASWVPYVANDVQVQFYMMSPYVLKTLSTDLKVSFFVDTCKNLYFYLHRFLVSLFIHSCSRDSITLLLRYQMFMEFSSSKLSIRGLDTLVSHFQSRFQCDPSDTMNMKDL
ncbi:dolichyl-diphosphooligosaccharide--glycosyltransferase 48 kDa subunit-like [Olea europaea subsp. europaea]|uniref:Dolichyl-diphosphooligosaccharide--protein glycosyltransferase 48 kDa subunit n=1 Tax=Olea europaea subsp. europaea TaxID=158383 RepID=A0A8S0RAB5_OLEEU|nr:dolichyl-diphosphooligosaccharide--glycosyltransferase 48 kDa subunit-like [Olea europaea subsp. europaea]